MLFAQRSNRVHSIQPNEIEKYLNLGYNIVDNKGVILYEAMPEDVMGLKVAFKRHVEEIAKLKADVEAYKAQMAEFLELNNQLSVELEMLKEASQTKGTRAKKSKTAENAEE
jgi:hypothetical protein